MPANRSAATRPRGGDFEQNDLITDPKPREVCTIYEIEGILTCPPDDDARSRAMSQVLIAIVDDEEPVRDATKSARAISGLLSFHVCLGR